MFDYFWDCYFVILLPSFHQFINTKTHLIVCGTLSLFFIEIYWHPKLNKAPKEIKRAQASTKKALFYYLDAYGTHFLILRPVLPYWAIYRRLGYIWESFATKILSLLLFIFATFWATFVGQLQGWKVVFLKKVLTFLAELLWYSQIWREIFQKILTPPPLNFSLTLTLPSRFLARLICVIGSPSLN